MVFIFLQNFTAVSFHRGEAIANVFKIQSHWIELMINAYTLSIPLKFEPLQFTKMWIPNLQLP